MKRIGLALATVALLTHGLANAAPPTLTAAEQAAAFRAAGFKLRNDGRWRRCDEDGQATPRGAEITSDDLNGDGVPEAWLKEGGTFCYGNTAAAFVLLTKTEQGWQVLLDSLGLPQTHARTAGEWPDVLVGRSGVGPPPVYRHTGATYALADVLTIHAAGVPDPRLEGVWKLTQVDGTPPPAGRRRPGAFHLEFREGQVIGRRACNGFFGPYRVVGVHLEVALAKTTVGCAEDHWDAVIMDAVRDTDFDVSPDGATLTLRTVGGRTLRFRRRELVRRDVPDLARLDIAGHLAAAGAMPGFKR